jgi:hypothetical protein
VLAHPADTRVHRAIDPVSPDDDEVEAVLAHVRVERRSRLICLDHLLTDTDCGGHGVMVRLCFHLGNDLTTAFGHFLGDLVGRLGPRATLQDGEHDHLSPEFLCEVNCGAKSLAGVSRPVPPHENPVEARQLPSFKPEVANGPVGQRSRTLVMGAGLRRVQMPSTRR